MDVLYESSPCINGNMATTKPEVVMLMAVFNVSVQPWLIYPLCPRITMVSWSPSFNISQDDANFNYTFLHGQCQNRT